MVLGAAEVCEIGAEVDAAVAASGAGRSADGLDDAKVAGITAGVLLPEGFDPDASTA